MGIKFVRTIIVDHMACLFYWDKVCFIWEIFYRIFADGKRYYQVFFAVNPNYRSSDFCNRSVAFFVGYFIGNIKLTKSYADICKAPFLEKFININFVSLWIW